MQYILQLDSMNYTPTCTVNIYALFMIWELMEYFCNNSKYTKDHISSFEYKYYIYLPISILMMFMCIGSTNGTAIYWKWNKQNTNIHLNTNTHWTQFLNLYLLLFIIK